MLSLRFGLTIKPTAVITVEEEVFDGAGTPVTISTSIPTNQAFQRGKSSYTLSGTYSLTGEPTGFLWKVGSGDWVQLASETIGSGSWSGTMSIPSTYLAQGTLQVVPKNGPSVTPAQVSNITVSDVFVISGQSNAGGKATNLQSYTGSTYKPMFNTGSGYVDATSLDWGVATGSCWPRLASLLDAAGIPPVIRIGAIADGTGFKDSEWTVGSLLHGQVISRLNADVCGGFAGFLWDQGEADIDDSEVYGKTDYKSDFLAALSDWRSNVPELVGVPVFMVVLGESGTHPTHVQVIRQAQIELIQENSGIEYGTALINEDYFDSVHYGTGSNDAQVTRRGSSWYRAISYVMGYDSELPYGPIIQSATVGTGANSATVTVTFDRAVQNHTDETGWSVSDSGGAVVSSSAQGATANSVVLTCDQALYGPVTVVWGDDNDAVGSTLVDTGTIIGYPPLYEEGFAAAGTGEGAAPVNTVLPVVSGNAVDGATLSCSNGTWTAVPSPTFSFQWLQDGSAISGATSSTYDVQTADVGHVLACSVNGLNAVGNSTATSANTATVASGETLVLNYVTDGTTTGMAALNGTYTTAQPDPDGGNNAVLFTCGTGPLICGAYFANKPLYDGVNIVRFKFKMNTWASANKWIRPRFQNITQSNALLSVDIANNVFGTVGSAIANESWTSIGDGWYQFYCEADLAGADVTGNFYVYMADADNDQNLDVTAADHSYFLYDLKITHL